jgi:16S rRNA (cytidine1402-2'-O)-methyltransferase
MAKLFLIPTTLANPINGHVLTNEQLTLINHLNIFIVETAKIGRQHLKQLNLSNSLQSLTIMELNKHQQELVELINPLLNGNDVGILSDCGLPAVADPGNQIVRLAHENNIEVVPLIGPSSLLLALMSSGVNGQSFAFNGYLPIDKLERKQKLDYLVSQVNKISQSQIIIEAPFRNQQLLEILVHGLPNNFILSLAINLMNSEQKVISHTIKKWKDLSKLPDINKQEVVFVFGV